MQWRKPNFQRDIDRLLRDSSRNLKSEERAEVLLEFMANLTKKSVEIDQLIIQARNWSTRLVAIKEEAQQMQREFERLKKEGTHALEDKKELAARAIQLKNQVIDLARKLAILEKGNGKLKELIEYRDQLDQQADKLEKKLQGILGDMEIKSEDEQKRLLEILGLINQQ